MHIAFATPLVRIVERYAHQNLTSRREAIATLGQMDGISGLPSRAELPYDIFGAAHSSVVISTTLGAVQVAGPERKSRCFVALVGDGATSVGFALKTKNNVEHSGPLKLSIIRNDYDMLISPLIGRLRNHISFLRSCALLAQLSKGIRQSLLSIQDLTDLGRYDPQQAPDTIELATPIDGHDRDSLIQVLRHLHELDGPQFLHIVTRGSHGSVQTESIQPYFIVLAVLLLSLELCLPIRQIPSIRHRSIRKCCADGYTTWSRRITRTRPLLPPRRSNQSSSPSSDASNIVISIAASSSSMDSRFPAGGPLKNPIHLLRSIQRSCDAHAASRSQYRDRAPADWIENRRRWDCQDRRCNRHIAYTRHILRLAAMIRGDKNE